VIDAVLLGKDCLAVMRTGGGKFASYLAKKQKFIRSKILNCASF
jgi:hypothetical protein